MWRENLTFWITVIAALNGILAFAIAVMPRGSQRAKVQVGIAALVLGLLAIGTAVYSSYDSQSQQERRLADRREIRERLDGFIKDGTILLAQIKDTRQRVPTSQADLWAQRAETFLKERLGDAYVARYRADINPMLFSDADIPADRRPYWRAVRNRVLSLEAMSAEFPQ